MSDFKPCMVNLTGKKSVVVGGGTVAARKVAGLLDAGCHVKVISPFLCEELRERIGEFEFEQRKFESGDTAGAFVVIAATDSPEVNKRVCDEGRDHVPFLNIVDNQELSNFFFPTVVERGPLQIAISTTGTSPSVAKKIRVKLEKEFGIEYQEYLETIGKLRSDIIKKCHDLGMDSDVKKALLRQLAEDEWLDAFKAGDQKKVDALIAGVWASFV
ncbi:precorrin-2 dehydrogenase/sirohydrochlorin ferrochelatase family protein [Evansella tamaricis]|uniref:precorrin-2 dehydrogenase n=1 Tax=Evansella tamaricis TaxID=2069301 RepID=A0ABS6JDZ2_9BACI|nr:bifunctional precorrin-2 dehydrogenase/sirohydrochlorin ferrochelatase [Evansella tamaricis]MBU9711889.1 bifunctional precorrin-2 dehydrogenase/sirohydrochlorin ferrochelatase [Evansella tamaricis]